MVVSTPIVTTLDLLLLLEDRKILTEEQAVDRKTRLFRAGYSFIPLQDGDVSYLLSETNVTNRKITETAELKAIRESVRRVQMGTALQLPKESKWLESTTSSLIRAIKGAWRDGKDPVESYAQSEWLLELLDVRGFAHFAHSDTTGDFATEAYLGEILQLLLAPVNESDKTRENYLDFIDQCLIAHVEETSPELFARVVESARGWVETTAETQTS